MNLRLPLQWHLNTQSTFTRISIQKKGAVKHSALTFAAAAPAIEDVGHPGERPEQQWPLQKHLAQHALHAIIGKWKLRHERWMSTI